MNFVGGKRYGSFIERDCKRLEECLVVVEVWGRVVDWNMLPPKVFYAFLIRAGPTTPIIQKD